MAEQHEKTLVPQIRFAGFTDPWEQRKLGELFEEHSEKDRDDLPALTIIQGGGTVHRDESNRNLQFDRSSLSNYKVVDTGDFIVHLRSFEGGLEKATCYGLVSPAYHIFRGKNVDSDFYYLYFRSKRFIDVDLKPHVYGIRDGRSIDIEGMKTIFIPWTNLAEQRQIGAFFDHLDSLITLHQRKYDKLCVLKKSMLDKMFPKGGSLYPEIRFAGFTDPWEQRKMGELEKQDVLHLKRGIVISAADMESCPGNYPVYSSSASQNGEMGKYGKYMFNQELVTWSIDGGGSVFYRPKHKFSVTNVCGYVETSSMVDCAFLAYQMGYIHSQIHFDYTVKAHPSVIRDLYTLSWTSLTEQRRIGAFFDRLDSLITLHQRKYCGVASWMLGVALVRLGSESDGAFGEMKHVLR